MKPQAEVQVRTIRRQPAQERSRKRVDAIVDAAARLIGERGLEPASMTDIAREADMAITAVYRYFPNKQAIVRELAMRVFAEDAALADELAISHGRSRKEWVRDSAIAYCETHLHDKTRDQIRAVIHSDAELYQLNWDDLAAHAWQMVDVLTADGLQGDRDELFRRGRMLLSLLDGVVRMAAALPEQEASEEISRFGDAAVWLLLHDDEGASTPSSL